MIAFLILALLPLALPTYVIRFHIGPFPTTLLELSLFIFLFAWSVTRGRAGWRTTYTKIRQKKFIFPITLWLIAGIISVFIAPDHIAALGLFRAYFIEPILVLWMLTDLIQTERDKNIVLRSLALITIFVTIWAVIQFTTHHGIPKPWDTPPNGIRATGPFPFPNALALFVVPIAAFFFSEAILRPPLKGFGGACLFEQSSEALSESSRPRNLFLLLFAIWQKRRGFLWLGFLSGAISTALAKSVGGMLGLVVAVFITLLIQKQTRRWAIAGGIALVLISLLISPIRHKLETQFFFKEWSGKVRLVIWKETRTMLTDHPVFGAGLGAYPVVIKPYHKATWMEIFQYPHNILLNLWSEVGLLGIAAFSWILWRIWKLGGVHTLAFLAALLIQGLVDVPYFKNDLAVVFWIIVALFCFQSSSIQAEQ